MKKIIGIFLFILFSILILGPSFISAQEKIELIFFRGEGCPHCAKEEKFLAEIVEKYPEVEIKDYEVWYNSDNQKLFVDTARELGINQLGVPLTIIGEEYFLGYQSDEITGQAIEAAIKRMLGESGSGSGQEMIKVPFFGTVDLSKMSLPVLTITLGALDGLNPCAMWILLFLIILLISARSRKRMLLIAGTFVLASGIIYYLLLAAWLNLFLAISYIVWTRVIIGILAVGVGIWQVRNFFRYVPGTCRVIGEKPGIMDKIKNSFQDRTKRIAFSPFTLGIFGGIVLLAFGVNLIEFFCSAGLPAIYTRILTLNQLSFLDYYSYLLLYTFVFMLDDLIILALAVITLSRVGFTEKYNYWATLIGGLLILVLGLLLIFWPEVLMFAG